VCVCVCVCVFYLLPMTAVKCLAALNQEEAEQG
jgi:hypothetical protein